MSAGAPPRPLNVLFVMIQMALGGSERVVFNLARSLDRRAFAPSIAWLQGDLPLPEFAALGIPLYHVPKRRRVDVGAMRQLARIAARERIDIINAHHFLPFVYSYYASKASGAKLVYTEHSEADVASIGGSWQSIGSWLLRTSAAAVGITDRVTTTLQSHFSLPPDLVRTIENGVDVGLFREDETLRREARHRFGFADGQVVLGHVANFRRNKNHLFLVKAFAEVLRAHPHARLVLVGQGFPGDPENSEPDVARYVESRGLGGAVRLLGYRDDVQDLMRALDAFCLVSYKEGRPLSLIEAMASGLPVVGTDIEGIRGVVAPEVNGLLVPPDDVAALTGALGRLVSDHALRVRFGAASRELACSTFSLARCVGDTQDLFTAVARPFAGAAGLPRSSVVRL